MYWPSPQDYNEAIQTPFSSFADEELKSGHPEVDVFGLPRPISGAFAIVYRINCSQRSYAVRCFLHHFEDQARRYEQIGRHLRESNLPYFVGFEFIARGIRVGGAWYPILKMEWSEAQPLLSFLENNIEDSETVSGLIEQFEELGLDLRRRGIAHGDLQHGNILVSDEGRLKLVDYDGVFVDAFAGYESHEVGHRNYQHPARSKLDFDLSLDNFSMWVILMSLRCLQHDSSLWRKLKAGDECLLLRHMDFTNPNQSPAFYMLEANPNEAIQAVARKLRYVCNLPLSSLPGWWTEIPEPQDLKPIKRPMPNEDWSGVAGASTATARAKKKIRLTAEEKNDPAYLASIRNQGRPSIFANPGRIQPAHQRFRYLGYGLATVLGLTIVASISLGIVIMATPPNAGNPFEYQNPGPIGNQSNEGKLNDSKPISTQVQDSGWLQEGQNLIYEGRFKEAAKLFDTKIKELSRDSAHSAFYLFYAYYYSGQAHAGLSENRLASESYFNALLTARQLNYPASIESMIMQELAGCAKAMGKQEQQCQVLAEAVDLHTGEPWDGQGPAEELERASIELFQKQDAHFVRYFTKAFSAVLPQDQLVANTPSTAASLPSEFLTDLRATAAEAQRKNQPSKALTAAHLAVELAGKYPGTKKENLILAYQSLKEILTEQGQYKQAQYAERTYKSLTQQNALGN